MACALGASRQHRPRLIHSNSGLRVRDVVEWVPCELDEPGAVRGVEFDRGKTDVPPFIPLSAALLADIDADGALYFVTDPQGVPYNGFGDHRSHGDAARLCGQCRRRKLFFAHLRHSAASDTEDCGVKFDDIRHLTTHTSSDTSND